MQCLCTLPLVLVDFSFDYKLAVSQKRYHYRALFTPNGLQVKTHQGVKQTLRKLPISSVIFVFKIFASGVLDCLLYDVNPQKKIGHSPSCLLVRM